LISHYAMYIKTGDEYAYLASEASLYAHRADLFYSLCPEWTEVALEHYFRSFVLRFNSFSGSIMVSHSFEKVGICIEDASRAIKCVKLIMSLRDLISGKAAVILAQSQYSSHVFPLARKVKIVFDMSYVNDSPISASDVANVPSFYQLLLQMFPNICTMEVEKNPGDVVKAVTTNCEFEQCMMNLYVGYYHLRVNLTHDKSTPWSFVDTHSKITFIIDLFGGGNDRAVDISPAYSSFVAKVAHNIARLGVEDSVTIDKFVCGAIQGSPMQNIQHLNIKDANLSFNSLCTLIKQLPRMTQLKFNTISFDKEYQDMAMHGLHNLHDLHDSVTMPAPIHDLVCGAVDVANSLELTSLAMKQCADRLRTNSSGFKSALRLLVRAADRPGSKIVFTGVGKSYQIGKKLAATFTSIGTLAICIHSTEALHGDLGVLTPGDCVIALSYSGATEEVLRMTEHARGNNAAVVDERNRVSVIGMGRSRDSPLGRTCDAWIDSAVESELSNSVNAPTCSSSLMMAIGDALAVLLMSRCQFGPADFARNHPGGHLGRSISQESRQQKLHGQASVYDN
ncbi:hypothetical protein GGI20_005744, partial [Coemansia sp. BCRC 34301]